MISTLQSNMKETCQLTKQDHKGTATLLYSDSMN